MAFGLFKKNEIADIIFMGGKVYTQEGDLPWAEAVACKDGKILGVGDFEDLQELEGSDTEVVDLEGGIMLPGFIDTCGTPVLGAFEDACLFLEPALELNPVLSRISDYIESNPELESYFIFGYHESILNDHAPEQTRLLLDEICSDKPVAVLGESGIHAWFNTFALDIAKAAAAEDAVETITLPYVLSVLAPLDFDQIQQATIQIAGKYCEKGFTSVFDGGAPDYFDTIYQDILVQMLQEEMAKQRYYGSLLISRNVDPAMTMRKLAQKKTNCNELDEYLNFSTLKLVVNTTGDAPNISQEVLEKLCLEAGDKGFDIHIDAFGEAAVHAGLDALESTRNAGYRKNIFALSYDDTFSDDEVLEALALSNIRKVSQRSGICSNFHTSIEDVKSIAEAVDTLTIDAAIRLGISDKLGSIKRGKYADFVIFDENIFDAVTVDQFKKINAAMTVINGSIVYDAQEDDMSQWYEMMTMQQC